MSTRPIAARPKAAKDIKIGDVFRTMTAEGERRVVVVECFGVGGKTAAQFACRDVETGKMLPKFKHTEDLGQ
jgi:hypothetical protein